MNIWWKFPASCLVNTFRSFEDSKRCLLKTNRSHVIIYFRWHIVRDEHFLTTRALTTFKNTWSTSIDNMQIRFDKIPLNNINGTMAFWWFNVQISTENLIAWLLLIEFMFWTKLHLYTTSCYGLLENDN